MTLSAWVAACGLGVFVWRLQPWRREPSVGAASGSASARAETEKSEKTIEEWPFVSIIVPCRNEERRLKPTLESLTQLNYPRFEVLVVDDESTDRTVEVASQFPVTVLRAGRKPEDWVGKSWACHRGAQAASGDLFLFTDADTVHQQDSLLRLVGWMNEQDVGMVSAPPFHQCALSFEIMTGLFHLFPLIATAHLQKPQASRVYCIGQYLLFRKAVYGAIGGHKGVASSLVEDLDLAVNALKRKIRYAVYPTAGLYRVQMFPGFSEFLSGWSRLIRLGLGRTTWIAVAEVVVVIHLFTAPWLRLSWNLGLLGIAGIVVLAWAQSRHLKLRAWTAFFAPVSVLLFTGLTVAAVLQKLAKRAVKWRGRSYSLAPGTGNSSSIQERSEFNVSSSKSNPL